MVIRVYLFHTIKRQRETEGDAEAGSLEHRTLNRENPFVSNPFKSGKKMLRHVASTG